MDGRGDLSGLHAIVLAAGAGSRFGGGKLMAPWRGGVLIDGALNSALTAPVEDVRVVVGADETVAAHVLKRSGFMLVRAPDHALGLSASLKAGVAVLPQGAVGALIFLGDMPLVPQGVLRPLAQALAAGAPAAVPVWQGRQGHPAAISSRLFPQIMALSGDRGARAVLDGLGEALALIEAPDAGVLFDIDRPEDLP
jgi:molybdenum cofactor cytidylyltransferase